MYAHSDCCLSNDELTQCNVCSEYFCCECNFTHHEIEMLKEMIEDYEPNKCKSCFKKTCVFLLWSYIKTSNIPSNVKEVMETYLSVLEFL